MLDIKFIRENKDLIAQAAKTKHTDFDVEKLLNTDDKRSALLAEVEVMGADQNDASNSIVKSRE